MNGRIAALSGRVPELTAAQLDGMDTAALAALYSSGVRLLTVKNSDTITLHAVDSNGVLTWLDTNMPRQNLLDNAGFWIAQAGYGGLHGLDKYAADRWLLFVHEGGSISAQMDSYGILSVAAENRDGSLSQRFEPLDNHKTYTATFTMVFAMPLFSLIVTFTVPGGVGIYWICSNLIAIVQTIVLNTIYNPVKIRAQAEAEYEERRRKKAEDKKRLAESRAREQEEARRLAKEEAEAAEEARRQASEKKPVSASRNPNKKKRRAQAQEETDTAVQPAAETPAPSETTPDSAQGTEGPANEENTGDQPQA